jgi:hypothetical protein
VAGPADDQHFTRRLNCRAGGAAPTWLTARGGPSSRT